MTRKDVLKKQLIAGAFVLVLAGLAIFINLYLRTFPHEVHLGKLVYAGFSAEGPPAMAWTDPQSLATSTAGRGRLANCTFSILAWGVATFSRSLFQSWRGCVRKTKG